MISASKRRVRILDRNDEKKKLQRKMGLNVPILSAVSVLGIRVMIV